MHDAITRLQASLGCGRILLDPADNRRLIQEYGVFVMHHVDAGEQSESQQNVHGWPSHRDDEALPARMREEFRRVPAALIHGVLTTHFDVAAQRNSANAVIGVTLFETQQARSKADGKRFNPHAEVLGGGIVAEFVDQDHEP